MGYRLLWVSILILGCSDEADPDGDKARKDDVLLAELADSEPDVAKLYADDAFETFELVLSDENLKTLDDNPTAEQYVEGEVVHDGENFPAGIRYKGSVGAWYKNGGEACVGDGTFSGTPTGAKSCQKLSLKVSFNEYDPEGRFLGLKKVLFHSMNQDASLLRERLAYEMFREAGVAAPRASHARVLINGEFQGVYAFIEYIDGRFTRARWDGGEGNLYKEVWPAVNDTFVENTEQRLLDASRSNEDELAEAPSFEGMLGFEAAMAEAEGDEDAELAALEAWFDVDYMLSYMAADRATAHDDGILHFYPSGNNEAPWSNHNFFMYEAETHDRMWVIPWDMDNAWSSEGAASAVTRINAEWNDTEVGCEVSIVEGFGIAQIAPACSPVIRALAHPDLAERFEERVAELLDGPLSEDVMEEKIARYSALLADSVEEASAFEGELSMTGWEIGKEQLRTSLAATRNKLRAMLGRKLVLPESVTIRGLVTDTPMGGTGLEGVEVCVYQHDEVPCVETDGEGAFELAGVAANSEPILTYTRDDLVSMARNYSVNDSDVNETLAEAVTMWTKEQPFLATPAVGKGSVQLFPYGVQAGHVLTVSPNPGTEPVYFESDPADPAIMTVNPELTETSAAGSTALIDAEPGEYHAQFTGCMAFLSPQWGLPPSDGTTAVRFRIIAGYVTNVVVQICSGPPAL
jgi:hypothetical protein